MASITALNQLILRCALLKYPYEFFTPDTLLLVFTCRIDLSRHFTAWTCANAGARCDLQMQRRLRKNYLLRLAMPTSCAV
jgi:hypothetical protein